MANQTKNSLKRKCDEREDDEDFTEDLIEAGAWPRYLIVEGDDPEKPLHKLTPFAVERGFQGVSSSIKNIEKLKNGSFLVECPNEKVSKALLGRDRGIFVDRKIRVTAHRSLNSSKGVIRCRELMDSTDIDILEGLKSQGVIEVHRVMRKQGDTKVPTHTFFLTFALPKLPERIKVGYLNVQVSMYVPAPLRCFNCQKFGHSKIRCRKEAVCERCGHQAHENACSLRPTCSNCQGDHPPNSRQCPTYIHEQEIQKVKTQHKISFAEAKKKVGIFGTQSNMTFAQALKKKTVSSVAFEAQVGDGIPQDMLEKLRKDYPNVNRPSLLSGKVNTSTQACPGSSASAPAPQAAGAKQTIQSARQGPKPAPNPKPSSLTPTPARQEVRVDARKPVSPTRPSSQEEARVEKYRSSKYQPKAQSKSTKALSPSKQGATQPPQPPSDRLKKAEKDLITSNRFGPLSDEEEDYLDC